MSTVLVTGAAGGIGKSVCEVFHTEGYNVIGVDRQEITDCPYDSVRYDIRNLNSSPEIRQQFYRKIEAITHGQLDCIVNNAAIQIVKPVEELNDSDWKETLDTNLLAPFWLIQTFLPLLRQNRGNIVNIASIHATATKSEFTAYATSKGALVSLTRALAVELAPDIRVNAVIPAATDTPMLRAGFGDNITGLETLGSYHPLRRIADPQEVANVVMFLASEKATFMTGSAVNVDGGIGDCLHDPVVAR
jgi:NAD(P)-dependent dehydrogenase (short-subunit alcohol dehydrogenase family)